MQRNSEKMMEKLFEGAGERHYASTARMNSKSDTRRDHSFSTAHKAAEELRLEGNGSHDPMYPRKEK